MLLKRLLRRRAPPEGAVPAGSPHVLDGPLNALFVADGTLSRAQFQAEVLPLLKTLHGAAGRRDADSADAQLQTLIEEMAAACRRAADRRLPLGRPVADYRRFETRYNYALISAMAIAWYMEQAGLAQDEYRALAEALLPPPGRERLQRDAQVWDDWQAFFVGGDDGGLRDIAGRHTLPGKARVADQNTGSGGAEQGDTARPAAATRERKPKRPDSGQFVAPERHQWANPLAKGWVLVEAIREGLRDGSLPYNRKQAWVQVDREGRTFLQVPEVFEWCYERLDADDPPKTLVNQFGRLNICTRTHKGQNLLRGGRHNQKTYQQGFVVEDPGLFWDGEPPADQFYIRHLTRHGFEQSPPSPPDPAA